MSMASADGATRAARIQIVDAVGFEHDRRMLSRLPQADILLRRADGEQRLAFAERVADHDRNVELAIDQQVLKRATDASSATATKYETAAS